MFALSITTTDKLVKEGKIVNKFKLPHTAVVAIYHTDLFDSPVPTSLHSNVYSSEWEFWNCSLSLTSATVDSRILNQSQDKLCFCPVYFLIRTYLYDKRHSRPLKH